MSKKMLVPAPFPLGGSAYHAVYHVGQQRAKGHEPVVDWRMQRGAAFGRRCHSVAVIRVSRVALSVSRETAARPDSGASDSDMRQ
jgi:hypothetical protein